MEAERVHKCIQDVHPVFSNFTSRWSLRQPPRFSLMLYFKYVLLFKENHKKVVAKKEKKKGGLDL